MGRTKMKLLVITRADSRIHKITDMTFPMLRGYAEKCNADFLILDKPCEVKEGDGQFHYRLMECKNLLENYDRILHLDADIFISKNCPVLFNVVPNDMIGSIYEDVGSRMSHRRQLIKDAQEKFGYIGWIQGYINTGVFVVSSMHKDIFNHINGEYWHGFGHDDVTIGYNIVKYGFKVCQLPYQYNHMSLFSEDWNHFASRFDSYCIHYAGEANFVDRGERTKLRLMRNDFESHRNRWI